MTDPVSYEISMENTMKRFLLLWAAVVSLGAMTGCDDDDDRSQNVPSAVQSTFVKMFPGAGDVEWSKRSGYLVVDFRDGSADMQAWFDAAGRWYMTETELTYGQLPEAVRTAFETGEYAAWRVKDADRLQREGLDPVYVLEVGQRETEYELLYAANGVLLRAAADTDDGDDHDDLLPAELPQAVTEFLEQHYPGARIVEAERRGGMLEVEIMDGRTLREVLFGTMDAWVSTSTEVRPGEVPAAVLGALETSEYGAWTIDGIDHFESPDDEWYLFDMEQPGTDREKELRIRLDGTIF